MHRDTKLIWIQINPETISEGNQMHCENYFMLLIYSFVQCYKKLCKH